MDTLQFGVSEPFLEALERLAEKNSWWRDVLLRDDVFLAVRRNSLNVYHRGGSIFRIDDIGAGLVSPKTHVKYLVRQQQALAELLPKRDVCFAARRLSLDALRRRSDTE